MADPLRILIVAGEESGDQLGARLMRALKAQARIGRASKGSAGRRWRRRASRASSRRSDIAVMGFTAVAARLPTIMQPHFAHGARRDRRRSPMPWSSSTVPILPIASPGACAPTRAGIPIVDYVSPSVWAWRPGRAKAMRAYVDHVLALLPFEPEAHRRLGGPPTTYAGHPLIERLRELRPAAGERPALGEGRLRLLVLPGSRRSEVSRSDGALRVCPSACSRSVCRARSRSRSPPSPISRTRSPRRAETWPTAPRLVHGEAAKWAAFRAGPCGARGFGHRDA